MSIWLNALAGGIQGLGASISAGDQEKREARGLALRESYLSKRQDKSIAAQTAHREDSQEFTAEQGKLTRALREEQGKLTREHQSELAGESREFQMEMAQFTSGEAMKQINTRISAASSEGDKDRQAAAERLRKQLEAAGIQAARRNELASFEQFVDEVQRRAKEFPAQDSEGQPIYNDAGDTMPDFALEQRMVDLYIAGGNVPTWQQPPLSAQDLIDAAGVIGGIDAAIADAKRVGYRVPDRAIAEARKMSMPPTTPTRTGRSRSARR